MSSLTLARSSKIRHPLGNALDTPLLIPSFSSKGFGFATRSEDGQEVTISEANDVLVAASEFLTEAMLVSAYDIHYGFVTGPDSAITEITFLDSGGYETSDVQDLSATFIHGVQPREWDRDLHESVLDVWPKHIPAVFISFDRQDVRLPLTDQIDAARRLTRHSHLAEILVKPETRDQKYVQVKNVVANAEEFAGFDLIGFTEKELGDSFLTRMLNIANIRRGFDAAGVAAPMHIFGSLDPISVPLYYFAGAEVFDGLTWLRFGYDAGAAIYRHNYAARRIGIDRRDAFVKLKTMQDNLGFLADLTNRMRRFLNDEDFAKFGPNRDTFAEAVDLMRTRIPRVA